MALFFFLNLMEYPFRGGSGGSGGVERVFRVKIAKKTPKKAKISTIQPISNDLNVEGQPHMTSAHPLKNGYILVSFFSCYQKTLSNNALGANFTGEP